MATSISFPTPHSSSSRICCQEPVSGICCSISPWFCRADFQPSPPRGTQPCWSPDVSSHTLPSAQMLLPVPSQAANIPDFPSFALAEMNCPCQERSTSLASVCFCCQGLGGSCSNLQPPLSYPGPFPSISQAAVGGQGSERPQGRDPAHGGLTEVGAEKEEFGRSGKAPSQPPPLATPSGCLLL